MKLTWFGHSACRLEFGGHVVLIDPFFTGNPGFRGDPAAAGAGATHILLTHGHGDHVGDTLRIAAETGAMVVANFDLCMWLAKQGLAKFSPMNTGGTIDAGGFSVTMVRADHSAAQVEAEVAFPLGSANGLIVKAPGEATLWHMGDTDIFSDMALIAEIHGVETAIVPIGDRFTMGARTAALALTRFVKPKRAVPVHYGSFPIIDASPDAFIAALEGSGIEVLAPPAGGSVSV